MNYINEVPEHIWMALNLLCMGFVLLAVPVIGATPIVWAVVALQATFFLLQIRKSHRG